MKSFQKAWSRTCLVIAGSAALALVSPNTASAEVTRQQVETAISKLEIIVSETLHDTGVPGMAIAIVHNDEVVYLKGFGVREVGGRRAVDADTVFQLASVSKPITSTVLAALVGEEKIAWDDPVTKYDRAFQLDNPYVTQRVTFRDLMAHRTGLPDHAGDLLEDLGYDRAGVLSRLRQYDLGNRFRSAYAYTNFGITEAAHAGALAANIPWETLVEQKLFRPLKMTRTSARYSDYDRQANKAVAHVPANGKFIMDGTWVAKYKRNPDAQSPAGGVSSTARDMAQWMRLQLGNGKLGGKPIIDADALAETHKPHMLTSYDAATQRPGFYGLGWNVDADREGRVFWKHSGAFMYGVRTQVALLPSENLGIVVLVNAGPNGVPEGLGFSFFDLVLYGAPTRDWVELANEKFQEMTNEDLVGDGIDYSVKPPRVKPPLALREYEGTYRNDFYGPLTVKQERGKLVMKLGPSQLAFPLEHYDGNTFYYLSQGEMFSGTSGAVFDGRGKVILNSYNKEGLGVFKR